MKILPIALLVLIFCLSSTLSFGQSENSELDNTQISILTCRSGDELYSTFGHTAIRINNPETNLDIVYNYGLFSFNTPNFYIKFMRGKLPYLLGATKMDSFLSEYHSENRSVFEQKLILTNAQKEEMISFLVENAKPENRQYKYDFFYDNCATRVVDVFSMVGDVSFKYEVEEKTFRDLLKENLKSLVWSDFGIDLVIGARADQLTNRRHQMFLPEYVMNNLASAQLESGESLASQPYLVLDFESLNEERKKKSTNWPLISTLLLLLITIIVNVRAKNVASYYNKTLLSISGILGLFLVFMWFGTDHGATRDNWNTMWLNPLILALLFVKGNSRKWLNYLLMALLAIAAVNCIFTFLPQFFNIAFLPIILSLFIILYVMDKQHSKPLEQA